MKSSTIRVAAVSALLCSLDGRAQVEEFLEDSLEFCDPLTTPMPDPKAPSFYRALPVSTGGMIANAGWSGHVRSWFERMRSSGTGAEARFVEHEARLTEKAAAYRRVVVEQGGKLIQATEKPSFRQMVQDLDRKKDGRVSELTDRYVNESALVTVGI